MTEDNEWLVYTVTSPAPRIVQSDVDSVIVGSPIAQSKPSSPAVVGSPIEQLEQSRVDPIDAHSPVSRSSLGVPPVSDVPRDPSDTGPIPVSSSTDPPPADLDLPISLHKGTRQLALCTYPYSIDHYVSYDRLSPSSSSLVASLDSISVPKKVKEALSDSGWRMAMLEELQALDDN